MLTAAPNVAPVTTQEVTPKTMEQTVAELAPKIQKTGVTSGKAMIAAREMFTKAEKRFGSDRDTVLEVYQPGQASGWFSKYLPSWEKWETERSLKIALQ